MVCMVFARVSEELLELKLAHVHSGQPRLHSLALGCLDFDITVLDASVSQY